MGFGKVTGIPEVIKSLEAIGANIETEKLQNRIKRESQVVIDTAKAHVPVDTGNLRDSIGFITDKDSKYRSRVLIGLRQEFYNYYLGLFFEFNTEPRISNNGAYRGVLKPRPFMRPALDQNREKVTNGVMNAVLVTVREEAKKQGFKMT